MLISYNLLKDFVSIPRSVTPEKLAELLTLHTAEVEGIHYQGRDLKKVFTGKLLQFEKIKGSKNLHKGLVDLGKRRIQLVFGTVFKVEPGWIMPIAIPGAKLANGLEIKKTKFGSITSNGMICSDKELGIEYSVSGLTIFPDKTPLGKPIADVLKLHDITIEIDNKSLTHRPDLWGHYGIAREIAAILNLKLKPLKPRVKFPTKTIKTAAKTPFSIQIKEPKLCPRFTAALIQNIEIKNSPQWLKSRLLAIGYRPINNIVDITNYVMAEIGQPSHAFDADLIKKGLIIRLAKKGEKFTTLDDKKHLLDTKTLLVCDHEKPVSLAGIMGGENSEVNLNTNTLIIEAANWEPYSLRQTAAKLGIRTEAVQRFEKSLDPALTELTVKRICELIQKLCPQAKIISPLIDVNHWKFTPPKIKLNVQTAQSVIGLPIKKATMVRILKSLGFNVKTTPCHAEPVEASQPVLSLAKGHSCKSRNLSPKNPDELTVTVPSFRATKDISLPEDLIEEIARHYGYENLDPILPDLPTQVPRDNRERRLKHRARQILSHTLGFDEVSNYSFYSLADLKKTFLNEKKHLKLANYLSEDQTHLRTNLLPNLLKNVAENLKHFDQFKLYEIGRTYQEINEYMPREEKIIMGLIVLPLKSKKEVFYHAKGALETFLTQFHAPASQLTPLASPPEHMHPAKAVALVIPDRKSGATTKSGIYPLGTIYELNPAVTNNFDIQNSVGVFEINFTQLVKLGQIEPKYQPLPKFPGLTFDVSVTLPHEKTVAEIQTLIQKTAPELIQNISLFDIFEDKSLGQDKNGLPLKALAFHIFLQAADRTLTDEEMTQVQKKVFTSLQKIGGKIRGL